MNTYPLESMSLEEAIRVQFRAVECITREFQGHEILTRGDLGVSPQLNRPIFTEKTERVIARIFDAEGCILVRGSGSGAIRFGLHSIMKAGEKILVHKAPIYSTTKYSLEMLNLIPIEADFNDLSDICRVIKENTDIKGALIQHTRQKIDDRYHMRDVIETIHRCGNIPILTDDNYAVMKVRQIGIQCGADLSCFSSFKLLGPEGIGIIAGRKVYIDKLREEHYSGGMQTQGHEALDVLSGLVYAPVALAVEAQVVDECLERIHNGEIPQVKDAYLANAQSRILLVEFHEDIAADVLREAEKIGAAPYPVGSESRYEMVPLFYRISGTFRKEDPTLERRMIRVNPMRAGADTVIELIKNSVERVSKCS